jgi:arginyl-tRNA synthetase
MNYLEIVRSAIQKSLGHQKVNFSVEIPGELGHGDVTSNFCLVISKVWGEGPSDVFAIVENNLRRLLENEVEKIEFKNPGFVNFYLKKEYIHSVLNPKKSWFSFLFVKQEKTNSKYTGKKVLVEFTSINLFKPFNIGHLMSNFIGEYVSRAIENQGGRAVRISYPSDVSIGIAKAIWIIKRDGGLDQSIFNQELKDIVKYLGECYVKGVAEYKHAEEHEEEERTRAVKNIANNLYAHVPSEDLKIFEATKKINIEYFEQMIAKLGTKFDGYIFESESGVVGKEIVLKNIPRVFHHSEGAVVYTPDESRKDISTSVFINSEGNPTYLAKDIGLLSLKFQKYSPLDYSIYIVDNEQNAHFKSVFDAAGKINKEWADKSIHMPHGRMTFKGAKMSSRLGGVPNGEEVIDAVVEDVAERSQEKIHGMSEEGKINLQREIALSALRISILRSKPGVNIDFDPERASSFEGDSGPYLCYTHARCCSLLEKASVIARIDSQREISNVERKVLQFQNVLKTSAEEIAPQKLVKYLFELAGEFNSFYATNKISDDSHNLYITKLVKDTLNKGLYILGINAPEKM